MSDSPPKSDTPNETTAEGGPGPQSPSGPPADLLKCDPRDYGFQVTTNEKGELVWLRPFVVLDKASGDRLTHDVVLDILETKAVNVLQSVIEQRRNIQDKMKAALVADAAGKIQ